MLLAGTDDHKITASVDTLMRQAALTAAEYMDKAVAEIDAKFGPGFSREHPELVGTFMQTAAMDYGATLIAQAVQRYRD